MQPILIYCYDAYCGWCYGFSPVLKKVTAEFSTYFSVEVLSGGMILPEQPTPIGVMAPYIQQAYKTVENTTGITFGEDYLWHIFHPELSDWFPNSEKPAIALCIFKEYLPEKQLQFAGDLQYALNFEGRDLTDDEAYRHLLHQYQIPEEEFYKKLHDETYKEKAYYEFALCKQLQVTGYPAVLLQTTESKLYLLAKGFTDEATFRQRIKNVLKEVQILP
jgi:putative protein-disulfide isomerase